jgi:PASTA domain-containing protein
MDGADASTSSSNTTGIAPDIALQMVTSVALTMLGEVLGSTLTGRLVAGALGALLGAFLTAKGPHHGRRIVAVALLLALLDAGRAAAAQVSIGSAAATRRSFSAALSLRQPPALILAVAATGFALGTGATAAAGGLAEDHEPTPLPPVTSVRVPALTGLSVGEATARLNRIGLSHSTTSVHSSMSVGHVIATSPAAGARIARGANVTLDVSTGPSGNTVTTTTTTIPTTTFTETTLPATTTPTTTPSETMPPATATPTTTPSEKRLPTTTTPTTTVG